MRLPYLRLLLATSFAGFFPGNSASTYLTAILQSREENTAIGAAVFDCDFSGFLSSEFLWILNPTQENVEEFCQSSAQSNFVANLRQVVDSCGADPGLVPSVALLELVNSTICLQVPEEGYCFASLISMLPTASLRRLVLGESMLGALDIRGSFTQENLQAICILPKCYEMLQSRFMDHVNELSKQTDTRGEEILSTFKKLAGDLSVACERDTTGNYCAAGWQDLLTDDGQPDMFSMCRNNDLKECARKFIRRSNVFGSLPFDHVDIGVCGGSSHRHSLAARAGLRLKNLLYSYFEANREEITEAIRRDLSFNIPDVLPEEINIFDASLSADGISTLLTLGFNRSSFDFKGALTKLADLFDLDQVFLPNLDSMPNEVKVDEALGVSQSARLERIEEIIDSQLSGAEANRGPGYRRVFSIIGASLSLFMLFLLS